ncbi:MAG TPA: ABC transporter ATP-binding protein [Candidatus Sumerlaeota bacterium]|nr:MAG: putative multidrug export ATP-binding/permease protein [candidate division BRC1 bacterium ADurb.BinA292]HOE95150.1 ABC transporter ATP-binding protein [Candidatus Sumerlaeota bacterium]
MMEPTTASASASESAPPPAGWLNRLLVRWIGGPQSVNQGVLFRLLALFLPHRRRLVLANLLIILASFIGVFSLFAFLPILRVIFNEQPLETEPPPAAAVSPEHQLEDDLLTRLPLVGPLIERGRQRIDTLKQRLQAWEVQANAYLSRNKLEGILIIAGVLLLAALLSALLSYAASLIMARIEEETLGGLSERLYAHCIRQDLGFFHRNPTGQLMTRVYNDVMMLRQPMELLYSTTVREPVTMLFLLIFLLLINPTLTAIVLLMLPLAIIPTIILARRIRDISREEVMGDAFIMDQMQTSFSGIKLIKSFGSEDFEAQRFGRSNRTMFRRRFRRRMIKELASSTSDIITIIGVVAILVVGALLLFQFGIIGGGAEFMLYLLVLNRFYKPIKKLSALHVGMQRALMSAERIFDVLDTRPRVIDPPDPLPWPEDFDFIRLEDLGFSYGAKEEPLFRHLNLWIPRDRVTAFIGRNGSGKTTLAALLCRFYLPTEGRILIGSTPLDRIAEKELRRRIVMLTQETILFNLTVLENIAYGEDDIDLERAERAARLTRAHEFIEQLPDGYHTVVGERGGRLSGGQARLLTLARVIYRDPDILILDEPEAALDVKNQAVVAEVLREVTRGRTTILITHKLSSVLHVDKLVRVRRRSTRTIRGKERRTAEALENYI